MSNAALQVINLQASYDETQVLSGISMYAMPGEAVVLLGRSGSGKRTMLEAISGHTKDTCSGSVRIIGRESLHEISRDISHLGLHQQPFETQTIADFTCEENLLMPVSPKYDFGGGLSLTCIYQLCPVLRQNQHRPASELSSGTRKLLALARLLRTGTNVMLINQFASTLCTDSLKAFNKLVNSLKQMGYAFVLAESSLAACSGFASRYYVLSHGHIVDGFPASELAKRRAWLDIVLKTESVANTAANNSQSVDLSFWPPPRPK